MDTGFGARARDALQKLLALFLCAPEISLIDVGSDPGTGAMVLRIHVRHRATRARLGPPEDVNGIPVRVIVTDDEPEE